MEDPKYTFKELEIRTDQFVRETSELFRNYMTQNALEKAQLRKEIHELKENIFFRDHEHRHDPEFPDFCHAGCCQCPICQERFNKIHT